MKEMIAKFITWLSGVMTVASILHWIPIGCGIIASILWMAVAYYKRHQSKNEDLKSDFEKRKAAIELQIAELQLKDFKDEHQG
jgi:hypothetical protein